MSSTGTTPIIDDGGSVGPVITKYFNMTFNLNNTPYEAGATQYDSGGEFLFLMEENGNLLEYYYMLADCPLIILVM